MALRDEVKEQRDKLKGQPFSKKASYFLAYYKWHVIIIATILVFVIVLVQQMFLSRREKTFYGIVLNADTTFEDTALINDFTSLYNINTNKNPITIEIGLNYRLDNDGTLSYSDVYTPVKLQVLQSENDLDFIIVDAASVERLSESGTITDMAEILKTDELAPYSDAICYFEYIDENTGEQLSAPVGIQLSNSSMLEQYGLNPEKNYVFCIYQNAPHLENTIKLLKYLCPLE